LFSGKVELGTGTQTAFAQIVAEELEVDVSAIT
jgi:CO/xanthine dehydrogenase Mo-binding subunit